MYLNFRWFGADDPVALKHLRQVPGVEGIVNDTGAPDVGTDRHATYELLPDPATDTWTRSVVLPVPPTTCTDTTADRGTVTLVGGAVPFTSTTGSITRAVTLPIWLPAGSMSSV